MRDLQHEGPTDDSHKLSGDFRSSSWWLTHGAYTSSTLRPRIIGPCRGCLEPFQGITGLTSTGEEQKLPETGPFGLIGAFSFHSPGLLLLSRLDFPE